MSECHHVRITAVMNPALRKGSCDGAQVLTPRPAGRMCRSMVPSGRPTKPHLSR